ncbi:peptidoglycan editing factor PgeF [Pseudazoarcus pumilus]|uniref:Purine nucleoside phosphorylase n=1 Tax=Pseudazoarcus pumilus TaxID=2067960 RepID=A0A2I6S7C5_9RHOO|nr:peptidoglycan editing factor PgeF [Pseudazoarcus pumilus]AUN95155.1 peptidoglycan editing factor PgeF [Pseudazoarcus pumilus]
MRSADWIVPDWPAPATVRALVTTRSGGVSTGPYAGLNLGDHVGDDPALVECNRRLLAAHLPAEPIWLQQVHGTAVADADAAAPAVPADAALARRPSTVCAVLTADCLPVLLCNIHGRVVAAAHAGWRGLAAGVLENTVTAMGGEPRELMAWLGPAIGPQAFEVGDEVRETFLAADGAAAQAFEPGVREGKWLADLYALARLRLRAAGVPAVHGGRWCTLSDAARFYSFRRDGVTGRFASLIWIEGTGEA